MGRKIFVSYKHSDSQVKPIGRQGTARAYVDHLIDIFEGDEIYKGEDNEDLSKLKDETIKAKLKEKLHDSSITIILISPGMKDSLKCESKQWIPWEISYSLKEIDRGGKTSHSNALLAVVLPDESGSYQYYIEDDVCSSCHSRLLKTNSLFRILRDNMFNLKEKTLYDCPRNSGSHRPYIGESSYIVSVKWEDFVSDMERHLQRVVKIRDNRKAYNLVKEVENG